MYGAPFWYVGPSYGLAKDTIWNDPRMLPQYVPDWHNPDSRFIKKSETELRVNFLQSGGQIYVYGADRPDLMRGPNPMGVVLDEFSVQKPEVWDDVIQPIMRSNPKAWTWFLFTPKGRNHAFKVFQYGQDPANQEWKSWNLPVTESGVFDPNQVEEARKTMSQATFNQEMMCEFIEGGGQMFRLVREAMTARPQKPQDGHRYVMGVDLAKVHDYTVMAVYDRKTNSQVYQDRFQGVEWPLQKKRIKATADHYKRALVVVDATGLGDPIADDLMRAGLAVEPFKITEQTKKELIEKLSIYIEQKTIRLLPIEESLLEFDNFSYDVGQTGKIRYGAPEGFNDDIVIAHALAVSSLFPLSKVRYDKPKSLIGLSYERAKKEYQSPNRDDINLDEWAQF